MCCLRYSVWRLISLDKSKLGALICVKCVIKYRMCASSLNKTFYNYKHISLLRMENEMCVCVSVCSLEICQSSTCMLSLGQVTNQLSRKSNFESHDFVYVVYVFKGYKAHWWRYLIWTVVLAFVSNSLDGFITFKNRTILTNYFSCAAPKQV